ncbi:MAG: hypothetical protein Fur0043_15090 [Anaerolineales bacterium]
MGFSSAGGVEDSFPCPIAAGWAVASGAGGNWRMGISMDGRGMPPAGMQAVRNASRSAREEIFGRKFCMESEVTYPSGWYR